MKFIDFIGSRYDLQDCRFIETRLPDAKALSADVLLIKIESYVW